MEEETPLWTNPLALFGVLVAMASTGVTVLAVLKWGDGSMASILTLAISAAILMVLTGFIAIARLETYVSPKGIEVAFRPIKRINVSFSEISSATACTYQPMKDFGGWGVRNRRRTGRLLASAGNEGVRLIYNDGSRLTIGSFDANGLAQAIRDCAEKAGSPLQVEQDVADSIEP